MANLPGGKSQARRVYGYIRAPKQEIHVVVNGVSRSFDAQALVYHRDFFHVINDALQSIGTETPVAVYEYDEDLIIFNGETSKSKSFNITFTTNPIVVLDVIPFADQENVNSFITSISTTAVSVGLSAPLSGAVRYRAIYAPIYPVSVQRNVLSSSFSYQISAGYTDLTASSTFSANYISMVVNPSQVIFTTFDMNSNNDADVAFVNSSSFGTTQTTGDVSSEITNRINFIAIA